MGWGDACPDFLGKRYLGWVGGLLSELVAEDQGLRNPTITSLRSLP
jgi:hypothetical protein